MLKTDLSASVTDSPKSKNNNRNKSQQRASRITQVALSSLNLYSPRNPHPTNNSTLAKSIDSFPSSLGSRQFSNSQMRTQVEQLLVRKLFNKFVAGNPFFIANAADPAKSKAEGAAASRPLQDVVELIRASLESDENSALNSMVRYIAMEVKKLLNSQVKLSQASFEALEQRVATEVYLREKKDAILKDREEAKDDDAVSHLSKV